MTDDDDVLKDELSTLTQCNAEKVVNGRTLWCSLSAEHPGDHYRADFEGGDVRWPGCDATYNWPTSGSTRCILEPNHPGDHRNFVAGSGVSWMKSDEINHPKHYNSHPSGIECIAVAEHHNFNIGNVLKYIWRAGLKHAADDRVANSPTDQQATLVDLRKASWYLSREISRLEGAKHE